MECATNLCSEMCTVYLNVQRDRVKENRLYGSEEGGKNRLEKKRIILATKAQRVDGTMGRVMGRLRSVAIKMCRDGWTKC